MAVSKTSAETKAAILRKSASTLPDRPSESGLSAETIRKRLHEAITGSTNSIQSELDRIVDEINAELQTEVSINTVSTTINYTLAGHEDKTYTQNQTAVTITIPDTVEHGFMASVNFKVGGTTFAVSFVNESDFTLKKVNYGESITDYTPSINHAVTLLFLCDGNYIYCYINEV